MIVTDLEHLAEQAALSGGLAKALAYLRTAPGRTLQEGRVEIDGSEVYALVQSYQTRTENVQPTFEAHRRYVDVQYVVDGREVLGWAPVERVAVTTPYSEERDALLGSVPSGEWTGVRIAAGQVVVLYPVDAHAPGLADGEPGEVTKIVVKVAVGH
jgi:YhcH/YjgK/YiaL family protein